MNQQNLLTQYLHAFLFIEGGPMSWKKLSQLLETSEEEVKAAAAELQRSLEGSGLTLVITEREIALATAGETSERIKAVFEEQLQRDIGEAGLEVLSTLLYRGPSKRSEIDYIRGVNTASTIRNLLSRGLIERSALDGREYIYRVTPELLAHLGVRNVEELPDYATIKAQLAAFEQSSSPFSDHATDTTSDRG
jgi:segregation and condensation protein B